MKPPQKSETQSARARAWEPRQQRRGNIAKAQSPSSHRRQRMSPKSCDVGGLRRARLVATVASIMVGMAEKLVDATARPWQGPAKHLARSAPARQDVTRLGGRGGDARWETVDLRAKTKAALEHDGRPARPATVCGGPRGIGMRIVFGTATCGNHRLVSHPGHIIVTAARRSELVSLWLCLGKVRRPSIYLVFPFIVYASWASLPIEEPHVEHAVESYPAPHARQPSQDRPTSISIATQGPKMKYSTSQYCASCFGLRHQQPNVRLVETLR